MQAQKIFVIEHCENCAAHSWNTRHDAAQYKGYAMNGKLVLTLMVSAAQAIAESVPNCNVVFNQVPKMFAMSDIYCQLVQNFDDSNPYYDVVPRIGSLEVSYNGVVSAKDRSDQMTANLLQVPDRLLA